MAMEEMSSDGGAGAQEKQASRSCLAYDEDVEEGCKGDRSRGRRRRWHGHIYVQTWGTTDATAKDCEDRLSGDHHLVTYHCFALVNTQQWRRVLLRPPSSLVLRDRDRGVKCKEKIGLDGATAVAIVLGTWPTLWPTVVSQWMNGDLNERKSAMYAMQMSKHDASRHACESGIK